MKLNKPRIEPLPTDQWNDAQRDALGKHEMRGEAQNIFKTLVHHEKLAKRWLVFANHILFKSSLSPRDRELAILRIGWLCQAEYEWAQHVILGKEAGLSDQDIEQVKLGPSDYWSNHERLIIQACDELHRDAFISDATWDGLALTYDSKQLIDLIFTVGQYNMVSMVLNSLGVPLDHDLKGF